MFPKKRTILFTLIYKGAQYPVQVARDEYHSLMGLISDHLNILGFGLCSGMGSCGTCMVTIRRNFQNKANTTLSCDVAVNDELANTTIEIQEEYY